MKKQILIFGTLALTIALSKNVQAQTPAWDLTVPNTITTSNTTNVGIATTTSPTWTLTVNGSLGFEPDNSSLTLNYRHISAASHDGLAILSSTAGGGWTDGSGILLNSNISTGHVSDKGSITFVATPTNNGDAAFNFVIGNNSFASTMFINKTGQIGLGTLAVNNDNLTLSGSLSFLETSPSIAPYVDYYKHIKGRTHTYGLVLYSDDDNWANSSGIVINSANSTDAGIGFVASSDGTNDAYTFKTYTPSTTTWDQPMTIQKDGKVVIGSVPTSTAYGYKLYVQSGILTERVKVAINGSAEWSDYVFADNYDLKSLDDVETFIKANKHLPDVPSAENVVKNGVDVGKMDATLLQKIEELTLYVIDLKKENDIQRKEIDALKRKQ